MSYQYGDHREWLATDEGVAAVAEVIRKVETVLDPAGAATMVNLWPPVSNNWRAMAAVDHVVRLGMIEPVIQAYAPAGQHRVFRRPLRSA